MALPKRVAQEIMADLDRAAQELDEAGYPGLADVVDEAGMALYVFGPEAEPAVEAELARVDRAFDHMEARRTAKSQKQGEQSKTAEPSKGGRVSQRGASLRKKLESRQDRTAAKWDDSDGEAAYNRMRKERRVPEIGHGVTALRRARMARLGLNAEEIETVERHALDRFLPRG